MARGQLRQAVGKVLARGKVVVLPVQGNMALEWRLLRFLDNKVPVDTDPVDSNKDLVRSNKELAGKDPRNISERKADSRAPR